MPPELLGLSATQHGIVLTRQAAAAGFSPDDLTRLVRAGVLHRVRRGALADAGVWSGLTADQRHRALVLATVLVGRGEVVLSHWSAAVLHGLPLLGDWPMRVHVTGGRVEAIRSSGLVQRHCAPLTPADVVLIDGVRVTAVTRTVLDLIRSLPFRDGVVVADAALHRRVTADAELLDTLAGQRRWPGVRQARRVLAFADARSESVGESASRVVHHELGLPPAELQVAVHDAEGFVGRSDFGWEDQRTVGEFDGKTKYGVDNAATDTGDILWREKKREDRLRGAGREVARWRWWHLEHPLAMEGIIRAAFRRGRR